MFCNLLMQEEYLENLTVDTKTWLNPILLNVIFSITFFFLSLKFKLYTHIFLGP